MRTFRNRILVLIIGLVVIAQTVTLVAVLARTSADVRARADEQLTAGASVARQLIDFRAAQLSNAVRVLAADFGLRSAVAEGDRPTILSAIENHGRRIGADLLLVLDVEGRLIASSHGEASFEAGLPTEGVGFLTLGDDVFQVFAAPVLAPEPIGWVAIGFAVDDALAAEIRNLVNVEIAFLARHDGGFALVAASLGASARAGVSAHGPALVATSVPHVVGEGAGAYLATSRLLGSDRNGLAMALLKPMVEVDAPYHAIRDRLLAIAAMAVALAISVGWILGRGATRPIDRLVAGARRVERGEYGASVEVSGGEEFERLASSFNGMQSGIADREARILHQAHYDAVTGLPNRQRFEMLLAQSLPASGASAGAVGEPLVVAIFEIANLRKFSGSLGFEFTDQVLREVARRLAHDAGDGRICGRLEGGRFALAVRGLRRSRAEALVEDACGSLRAGARVAAVNVRLDIVAGIAIADGRAAASGAEDPAELLRRAEIALDDAHERRLGVVVFEPEQDAQQRRRLQLSVDLPEAIESGRLDLVYQPKVTMAERRVRSAEVLARWTHGTLGEISPGEFIPVAEHTGAASLLTRWVLRESLRQLMTWHRRGEGIELAVNLSAADIVDPSLPDFVLGQLRACQVPPTALLLEITESAIMRDVESAARHMEQLRYSGVRFSIDDFGTGYSSLSQLKRLPVDELKIDRAFVRDAPRDDNDRAIVRSTIELGHSMGLKVVAEGVESDAQWGLLAQLGCDFVQGFLIARPMTATQFDAYLETTRARLEAATSQTAELRALRHSP